MSAKPRPTQIKKDIGRRLRAARKVVFDDAAGCARALDVPYNTWLNYEKGEKYPDPYGKSIGKTR